MKVTLIQATPEPIDLIAKIASICYDSKVDTHEDKLKLVKHLYRNGHESVFEHVYFTFKVSGISRACSHQLVRHRHCSFTQRSQRYCDESSQQYYVPDSLDYVNVTQTYLEAVTLIYSRLIDELDIPKEDARYILPNATCTEMYISMNLRELIHMCEERLCLRAQDEIRKVVQQMKDLVDPELAFMLVPRCGNPRLNCLEKGCKKKTEEEK